MKERIKKIINDAWLFAKGNKTIFLSIIWGCIEAGLIPVTGGWLTLIRIIITTLMGGSLYDHYKLGHFSTKKMVPKD